MESELTVKANESRLISSVPYRLAYRWWRNAALESKNPKECRRFALNQLRLARAIDADPDWFARKPLGQSDFQRYEALRHYRAKEGKE